jgi:hypothetical protein
VLAYLWLAVLAVSYLARLHLTDSAMIYLTFVGDGLFIMIINQLLTPMLCGLTTEESPGFQDYWMDMDC